MQKVEATAENNATSCHSSGYMACVERDRELIEKGSDAQVSIHSHIEEAHFFAKRNKGTACAVNLIFVVKFTGNLILYMQFGVPLIFNIYLQIHFVLKFHVLIKCQIHFAFKFHVLIMCLHSFSVEFLYKARLRS